MIFTTLAQFFMVLHLSLGSERRTPGECKLCPANNANNGTHLCMNKRASVEFAIMEGNFSLDCEGGRGIPDIQNIPHHASAWVNISLFEN